MSDDTGRDKETGQFIQGRTGNPKGRPKGSRSKLGEAFLTDLQADWKTHGPSVIATVRAERPQDYLKVVASILPKEHLVKTSPLGEMDDDELASRLEVLEQIIGFARGDDGVEGPTHKGTGTA